jgi:hypothetical protein
MRHISTIDITKRCSYDPKKDKLMDFLEEITDKDFQKRMKEVINWKNLESPPMKQAGLEAEKHYAPYLKSKIKDIPEEVLTSYSHHWYTDGKKFYLYRPCCL